MKFFEFGSCLLIIYEQTTLQLIDVTLRLLSEVSQQAIALDQNSFILLTCICTWHLQYDKARYLNND